MTYDYDFFISHASENKATVVAPLAAALESNGYRVWVDKAELTVGDRLLRRINDGIARSRFGIVILSPSYFAKNWPQWELEGLLAVEDVRGQKVVLPVRHRLTHAELVAIAPVLGGRLSLTTDQELGLVVEGIRAAANAGVVMLKPADVPGGPAALYAAAAESYRAGIRATAAIVAAQHSFTTDINDFNIEIARLLSPRPKLSRSQFERTVNKIVPVMRAFSRALESESAAMKQSYANAFLSLAQAAALEHGSPTAFFRQQQADNLRTLGPKVAEARESTLGQQATVEALTSPTPDFERNKVRLSAALQTCASAMRSVIDDATLAIEMLTPVHGGSAR